jgi:hypothetical protein
MPCPFIIAKTDQPPARVCFCLSRITSRRAREASSIPLPGLRGGSGLKQYLARSSVQIQHALLLTFVSFRCLASTVRSDKVGRSSHFLQISLSTRLSANAFCIMALSSSDVLACRPCQGSGALSNMPSSHILSNSSPPPSGHGHHYCFRGGVLLFLSFPEATRHKSDVRRS